MWHARLILSPRWDVDIYVSSAMSAESKAGATRTANFVMHNSYFCSANFKFTLFCAAIFTKQPSDQAAASTATRTWSSVIQQYLTFRVCPGHNGWEPRPMTCCPGKGLLNFHQQIPCCHHRRERWWCTVGRLLINNKEYLLPRIFAAHKCFIIFK